MRSEEEIRAFLKQQSGKLKHAEFSFKDRLLYELELLEWVLSDPPEPLDKDERREDFQQINDSFHKLIDGFGALRVTLAETMEAFERFQKRIGPPEDPLTLGKFHKLS